MKAMYLSISLVLIAGVYFTSKPSNHAGESSSKDMFDMTKELEVKELNKSEALVNYGYFKELVSEVEAYRSEHLISLEDFLERSKELNTVILDTRSKAMYDLKHVKGALHLNFSDFTLPELNSLFAKFNGTQTEILIYCNNNFFDSKATLDKVSPEFLLQDAAFIGKSALPVEITKIDEKKVKFNNEYTLALNIPTYINLYGYGFKNVYELNELVDVNDPRITFEGTFDDEVSN